MTIQGNGIGVLDPYSERLASLPETPRRTASGDGEEPGQDEPTEALVAPVGKTLADVSPQVLFKTVDALARSEDRIVRNRWAIDTHYNRVRAGVPFSRLEKVPNQSLWVAKLPNGMTKESSGATPNKADDLCNKVVDTLMADPPKLIPQPRKNDEGAEAAADLAAQFLQIDGGEAGTNDIETFRWALQNGVGGGASILHYRVDPTAGGYQPLQVLADATAQTPDDPVTTPNPILRYVSPDNQFVTDPSEADRVWLPKIVIDRMIREQIRSFPVSARPERAKANILLMWATVGEARDRFPKTVGQMRQDQLMQLAQWAPPQGETLIVPFAFRGLQAGASGPEVGEVGSLSPLLQRRMFWYRLYVKACPEYPKGFWADVSGVNSGTLLDKGDLEYTVTVPGKGTLRRCRDIPVVMICPQPDVQSNDPTGWPFISRFAGASEAEATLMAAFMDACDNMLHPHVFIRGTTAVDEDDWADRTVPIILGPNDQEPTYEQFPAFPPILPLVEHLETRQDTSSGLTATAQGLDSSNSVSGVAKNLSIRQALVSLSGMQQELHAGMTRGGRIKCQLVQAFFKTPQLLEVAGEDESGQARWWTGEDFAGVDDIGIQPGTGTMMTPEGKAQYVAFLQEMGWMTPEQGSEVALPGIRNDLGIPDDPAVNAIEREVEMWMQGPPQQPQAPQMGPDGQPVPPQPPPSPFVQRPNDGEPPNAQKVVKRLGKLMFDPKYAAIKATNPTWAAFVDQRYQAAMQVVSQAQQASPDAQAKAQAAQAQAQTAVQVAQIREQGSMQRAQVQAQGDAAQATAVNANELEKIVLTAALNPKVQAGDAPALEAGAVKIAEQQVPPA